MVTETRGARRRQGYHTGTTPSSSATAEPEGSASETTGDEPTSEMGPQTPQDYFDVTDAPLTPGQSCAYSRRRAFTPEDVGAFADLTGDPNAIHRDDGAAVAAGLPGAVVHGMLAASLFPAIIGTQFPGAVYLKQELRFRSPLRVGAEAEARVEVTRLVGRRAVFSTAVRCVGSGEVAVDGEALALLPPLPVAPP